MFTQRASHWFDGISHDAASDSLVVPIGYSMNLCTGAAAWVYLLRGFRGSFSCTPTIPVAAWGTSPRGWRKSGRSDTRNLPRFDWLWQDAVPFRWFFLVSRLPSLRRDWASQPDTLAARRRCIPVGMWLIDRFDRYYSLWLNCITYIQ